MALTHARAGGRSLRVCAGGRKLTDAHPGVTGGTAAAAHAGRSAAADRGAEVRQSAVTTASEGVWRGRQRGASVAKVLVARPFVWCARGRALPVCAHGRPPDSGQHYTDFPSFVFAHIPCVCVHVHMHISLCVFVWSLGGPGWRGWDTGALLPLPLLSCSSAPWHHRKRYMFVFNRSRTNPKPRLCVCRASLYARCQPARWSA